MVPSQKECLLTFSDKNINLKYLGSWIMILYFLFGNNSSTWHQFSNALDSYMKKLAGLS